MRTFVWFLAAFAMGQPLLGQGRPDVIWEFGALGGCNSAVYSPDGQTIAGGGWDNTIKLYSAADGHLLRTLGGHTYIVAEVAYSPDGSMLASAGRDFRFKVWRTSDWQQILSIDNAYHLTSVAWSHDGTRLATASQDHSVKLYRTSDWTLLRTYTFPVNYPEKVSFSPNGLILAVSGGDSGQGRVIFYDPNSSATIRTMLPNSNYMRDIAFSPDGNTLVSANGYTNIAQIWSVASGLATGQLTGFTGPVWSIQYSPDGTVLATGTGNGDNIAKLWSMPSGTLLQTLPLHPGWISSTEFSPDGSRLITGSYDIRGWNVSSGALLATLGGRYNDTYSALAFTPDGASLGAAIGSSNSRVSLFNTLSGAFQRDLTGDRDGLAFSPNGLYYASPTYANDVLIRRVSDSTLYQTLVGHTKPVYSAVFSNDGQFVVSGGGCYQNLKGSETIIDCNVRLWRLSDAAPLRTLTGHNRIVESVAISPDGAYVASCGDDAVKLWRFSDGAPLQSVSGTYQLTAFSPDGNYLAAARGPQIDLFSGQTGAFIRTLSGFTGTVYGMAFSPRGSVIAAGDWAYNLPPTIRFWRYTDGALVRLYDQEVGTGILSLAFSKDGATFAYSRYDKTVVMAGNPFAAATILPSSFTVSPGAVVSGGLADILVSDNGRLVVRPGIVFSTAVPPASVVIEGVSPISTVGDLGFTIESQSSAANVRQTVELFDFAAGQYVLFDSRKPGMADVTADISPTVPARFVQPGTRKVRAKISYRALGALFSYPWTAGLDLVAWSVTP